MPTYVYFWLALVLLSFVICVFRFRSETIYLFGANMIAAIISLLLYAPMIAGSGISFLLNASVETGAKWFSMPEIWQYNLDVSYFFTGFLYGFVVILLLSFFILAITRALKKYSFLFIFSCLLCLIPAITCALQNVQIPPRALAFSGLAIPILFSVLLSAVSVHKNNLLMMGCIIFTGSGAALISHRHSFLSWSINSDRQAKDVAQSFLQHQITTCYDNSSGSGFFYYYPAIEYYYRVSSNTFTLFTNASNSLRYKPFSPDDNYDCIVYHSTEKLTHNHYYKWFDSKKEGFTIYIINGK